MRTCMSGTAPAARRSWRSSPTRGLFRCRPPFLRTASGWRRFLNPSAVLCLWDLATGKQIQRFPPLPAAQAFRQVLWSPDSKSLVSYHDDYMIRIWDVATAKELRRLSLPPSIIQINGVAVSPAVFFMPDGKSLGIIEDWSVRVLDAADGKELRWFGGHTTPITSLALAPGGKMLATVAGDRHARLWDIATAKTVAKLPLPVGGGRLLSFDGAGKLLAVGAADHTVRVFDVASAREVGSIDTGSLLVPNLCLSKDGKVLYLTDFNENLVRTYDVATGKELFTPPGHTGAIWTVVWSANGKQLASSGLADHSIVIWDATNGKLLRQLPALENHHSSQLQFAPDGKTLLSFAADRTVRVWDIATGQERRSFLCTPLPAFVVEFSGDGQLVAVSPTDNTVRVWSVAEGKEVVRLSMKRPPPPAGIAVRYLFGPENRTLLTWASNETVVRRWDALTGKRLGEVEGIEHWPRTGRSVSTDGRNFLWGRDRGMQLGESVTRQVRQTFPPPPAPPPAAGGRPDNPLTISAAALSPDGRTLACAWSDETLHLWDTGSGKELAVHKGLPTHSQHLAFAPNGQTLATWGGSGNVVLWPVPGAAAEGRLVVKGITADKIDELWSDLRTPDAARAWQALRALESAPREVVPYVEKNLKSGALLDAKGIAKLIARLDSDDFEEREKVTDQLIGAGKVAEAPLKAALANQPSAEARRRLELILSRRKDKSGPDSDELLTVRGVELLERIGTPEAQKVLEIFAAGGENQLAAEARCGRAPPREEGAVISPGEWSSTLTSPCPAVSRCCRPAHADTS